MSEDANLWAVVFDDPAASERAQAEIRILQDKHCLLVGNMAVIVRQPDGSFRVDWEPVPTFVFVGGCGLMGLLAGVVLGQPLVGAAAGALLGGVFANVAARIPISREFRNEVQSLMVPGATVLLVMDDADLWNEREAILHHLRGLGGKVLKTNVDPGWAKEVQAALSAPPSTTPIECRREPTPNCP